MKRVDRVRGPGSSARPVPNGMDGFERRLGEIGQAGLAELREVLREVLRGKVAADAPVFLHKLKLRVYRLVAEVGDRTHSLILKRMDAASARRNELVARRWLPAMGLGHACPALLGIAADRAGRYVWHVYEDLGEGRLDAEDPDRRRVEAAVELIARLHVRSAGHPLLPEFRQHGGDLGIYYFRSNLRDAVHSLEALCPSTVEMSGDQRDLRDRLLRRLRALLDEEPMRVRALEEAGGPEMLLHGDLWTINAFVVPAREGGRACLIDWDHAGVGLFGYDLSTFLLRFPAGERPWILDRYRGAVERAGWRLPDGPALNLLFDTAERARYANRAIWPAVALLHGDGAHWGFEELAEVDRWFEALEPVLPV
ncbi:MAG TPA: phosphotransferase [Planctomycetota bacterium]|nr:phosphotransferase [Planctomycetota bacterium]